MSKYEEGFNSKPHWEKLPTYQLREKMHCFRYVAENATDEDQASYAAGVVHKVESLIEGRNLLGNEEE